MYIEKILTNKNIKIIKQKKAQQNMSIYLRIKINVLNVNHFCNDKL